MSQPEKKLIDQLNERYVAVVDKGRDDVGMDWDKLDSAQGTVKGSELDSDEVREVAKAIGREYDDIYQAEDNMCVMTALLLAAAAIKALDKKRGT